MPTRSPSGGHSRDGGLSVAENTTVDEAPAELDEQGMIADLRSVAASVAVQAQHYLRTCAEVASGAAPEAAIPLLLLAASDVLGAGARLGAMVDVVPAVRFEPDAGEETDLDPLGVGLARVLDGIDEYAEIIDPVLSAEAGEAMLSSDLTTIASALAQGLQHYEAGNAIEALWWWQFSYLSNWGERAASAVRMLVLILGHLRLDVADDIAEEAVFDALHS
jgi:Domain of unknown function (DUF5063)